MISALDNGVLITVAAKVSTGITGLNRVISCFTNMGSGGWTAANAKRVTFQLQGLGF